MSKVSELTHVVQAAFLAHICATSLGAFSCCQGPFTFRKYVGKKIDYSSHVSLSQEKNPFPNNILLPPKGPVLVLVVIYLAQPAI